MISQWKVGYRFVAMAALLGLTQVLSLASAAAQEAGSKESSAPAKQTVKETGKKASGAEDSNIKSNSDKNNPSQKMEPPPQKSGKKSRGAGPFPCSVHIDNHTPWLIRIYVDGVYRGTVTAYGDSYGITGNGPTVTYGIALFEDGSRITWGPHEFNCGAGSSYTWGLYQQ